MPLPQRSILPAVVSPVPEAARPRRSPGLQALAPLLAPAALAALGPDAGGVPALLWRRALLAPVEAILGRPGKGFRGRLTELAYRLAGGRAEPPAGLSALLEVVHAGSMIID